MQQQPVSDLMRDCSSVLIDEATDLRDAAQLLIRQDVPLLIVVNCDGQLAGSVTDSAIVRHLMMQPQTSTTVAAVMSRHAESVSVLALLSTVLPLFRSACHCVLPVVDAQRKVVGLLHRVDIVPLLLYADQQTSQDRHGADALRLHRPHYRTAADVVPQAANR